MKTIKCIENEGIIHIGIDQRSSNAIISFGDFTKKLCKTQIMGRYEAKEEPIDEIAGAPNLCSLCKDAWNDETIKEYVSKEQTK